MSEKAMVWLVLVSILLAPITSLLAQYLSKGDRDGYESDGCPIEKQRLRGEPTLHPVPQEERTVTSK